MGTIQTNLDLDALLLSANMERLRRVNRLPRKAGYRCCGFASEA